MKKIVLSVIATLALSTATLSAADYYATVDGEKITKNDIAVVLQDPRINFETLPKSAQKQVLEQIINKKLIANQAFKDGVENDKDYKQALAKVKQDLAFQVWQKNQLETLKISEKEQKEFFDKNQEKFQVPANLEARHILVKTEKEAKALIAKLDKAKKKEDTFVELAKTKSVGPTAPKGGYLGKFPANQMVPEFSKAAQELKKNTYSKKPVKTQFGYHVIFLKDKIAAKSLSFNEVKGNISKMLLGNAYNKKVKQIADDLRKKAKIVIK
ncbi:foldase protein PrsA [Poseidonibacter lekithochrous]|uniref:foldase protein PrsA n=1 Tax=Poseidonibacter lekithochrous TaxID=1904463 RepID=UPI0008FC9B1E|nr:peptidylprolyl isomerase [Poseidonibacter lekithochrous]QKJ21902.1 major antigenic peptide / PpiC-type peptidyl-prolyl cis-trans isomerase [Poseidonibacter lekithochrous]